MAFATALVTAFTEQIAFFLLARTAATIFAVLFLLEGSDDVSDIVPIPPLWDWKDKSGKWWRIYPDRRLDPHENSYGN